MAVEGPFLPKLMWINVSLAVFNLLPAFPMDGGRVLRAMLAFRMDPARATELAARVGQGVALLFGIVGLLANPMLLLIAFFVWVGAEQELSMTRLRAVLSRLPLRAVMITEFKALEPTDPISRAVNLTLGTFQHDFPVVDGGRLVGVVTRDDLAAALSSVERGATVQRIMREGLTTTEGTESLEKAFLRMQETAAPLAVVLDEGAPVGLLTLENVLRALAIDQAHRTRTPRDDRAAATTINPRWV
jgi:CBS domain-containing protein